MSSIGITAVIGAIVSAAGPQTRLVQIRPTEGRYVATDRGYMVPYQQAIPGSNAVIDMVPVPGGTVTLSPLNPPEYFGVDGTPERTGLTDGKPKTVSFGPFWIGKYEITMEQYMPYRRLYYQQRIDERKNPNKACDPSDVDAVTGPTEVYDSQFNFEFADRPDTPLPTASQFAARQYTKYLSLLTRCSYRLPLRSEWQHACLAGSPGKYCFGDDAKQLDNYAVYAENAAHSKSEPGELRPFQVGRKAPNAWGMFDVHGNVSEFVVEDSAVYGIRFGHVACGGNAASSAQECAATSAIRTSERWWDSDPDLPPSPWWMTSEASRMTGFRILSPLDSMSEDEKQQFWDADSEQLALDLQSRLQSGRGSVGRVVPIQPTTRRVDR